MTYNWQLKNWPNFTFSLEKIQAISVRFSLEFGLVNGISMSLSALAQREMLSELLIEEAIKTSAIEGEYLSRIDVMSSIKNNLGLSPEKKISDKHAKGIANLMVDVHKNFNQELTLKLICYWHKLLMQNYPNIKEGKWRQGEESMQIVSGAFGKEIVHFEAPPSSRIQLEMDGFLDWHNKFDLPLNDVVSKALVKASIAHLYFESINPFEDGNGRIGRTLAEFSLSQTLETPMLLSLSKIIEKNKASYYEQLKIAQRSLEITEWIMYFAEVLLDAQIDAKELIKFTLKKVKFFDKHVEHLNTRQTKAINKMLENGSTDFEGGMTAKKYISINKTSKATATRDLQLLNELGVFRQEGSGRSVRYML
ncbi:MAG: Fic family protein, partial [Pedobacter sp.]|nr:Fic family protein [Pedobacter sp.]